MHFVSVRFVLELGRGVLPPPSAFSRDLTKTLRGFFAMCVILHHIGLKIDFGSQYFAALNVTLGGIAVGVFFVLSAIGLWEGYKKDPVGYPKKILLVKIPLLYFTQVLLNTIYYLILKPELSVRESLISVFNFDMFFGLERLNSYSWYITTTLFIYLVLGITMLIANKVKNKKVFIGLVISVMLVSFTLFVYTFPQISAIYGRSLICFPLGLWYAMYSRQINAWLRKKKVFIISLISIILVTIIADLMPLMGVNPETILAVSICLLIIVLAQKFEVKSPMYSFLGEISLGFYMCQRLFIIIVPSCENTFLWGCEIIGLTLIAAYVFHIIYNFVLKYFRCFFSMLKEKPDTTRKSRVVKSDNVQSEKDIS